MKSVIIALLMLQILSGCAVIGSNFKACKLTAPSIVVYSNATQDKAADEIQGGQCPALNGMISDYSVMRDQSRLLTKAH